MCVKYDEAIANIKNTRNILMEKYFTKSMSGCAREKAHAEFRSVVDYKTAESADKTPRGS